MKCKDCKYFDIQQGWLQSDIDGACKRLGGNKRIITDVRNIMFISFDDIQNPSYVHVGAEFGCVHFDKEVENE